MSEPSEHRQRLDAAYNRVSTVPLASAVIAAHEAVIAAMREAAKTLWDLGECRWSAAYESRVTDLEVQARRHLEAIEQREKTANDNGGADAK